MSDVLKSYTFLPWLRTGLANSITAADRPENVLLRAEIEVPLKVEGANATGGTALTQTERLKVQLYGPGDIVGLDTKTIIKTEPLNWITNFEPNYMAYIDFYDEDMAWRYTPAAPGSITDRLRPWIMLVVLEESEFKDGKNIKDKPLPYIEADDFSSLFPPPDELWAWAHIHVNEELMNTIVAGDSDKESIISKFRSLVQNNPDEAYCRILCPRKLAPNKSYHSFLVPVFESGRLAGLGESTGDVPYAMLTGWESYPDEAMERPVPTQYPYYHRWYFRTGEVGDFEYLVRLLQPQPMDSRVGTRDMDVQTPGYNVRGIDDPGLKGVLKLGGALKIPEKYMKADELAILTKYEGWDEPYPHPFQDDLSRFLNLDDDYTQKNAEQANTESNLNNTGEDPLITPPIYGQWHALTRRLLKDRNGNDVSNNKNWLHNLNLDPRFRVAAGFGTKVVQENQENYMSAAWKQVGDILEANRRIRESQLALETSRIWYDLHLAPLVSFRPEKLFFLTAPLQSRVVTQGKTLKGHLKGSIVPESLFSSPMRRVMRPRGRMAKLLPFTEAITLFNLAGRINRREVEVVKPKTIPPVLPTHDKVAEDIKPTGLNPKLARWLQKNLWIQWVLIALAVIIIVLVLLLKPGIPIAGIGGGWVLLTLVVLWYFITQVRKLKASVAAGESSLTPGAVDDLPKSPNFRITPVGSKFRPVHAFWDNKESRNFKAGLRDSFSLLEAGKKASATPAKTSIDINGMVNATFTAINPALTIPRFVNSRVFLPGFILGDLFEKFTEAMAYPKIDVPMYEHLVNISSDLFLPNINCVPQNSISLLETNQKFIESYMVGLNHEFARELLWREYPTDQRGSYFRQFWNAADYFNDNPGLTEEQLKEKLYDIPPLHRWPKASKLGKHDNREEGGENEEEVVLVIRGELLKKYPNTVIYAHKAKWQMENGKINNKVERELVTLVGAENDNPPKAKVRTPLYEAQVKPDIYFFGFDLTAVEVKGESGETGHEEPGWFFIIKERPGEPRFGLDIGTGKEQGTLENPDVWNDMSWDFMKNKERPYVKMEDFPAGLTLSTPDPQNESEKNDQHADDVQVSLSAGMNSAEIAYILFQSPVMVAVHGSEMLSSFNS